jgi:cytoskeletal protein RodZ
MTDMSPGPGWWLASDGKWYPPHLHPDVRDKAPATAPVITLARDAPAHGVQSLPPYIPREIPREPIPPREPIDWERIKAERAKARRAVENRRRLRVLGSVGVAVAALAAIAVVARNDRTSDTGSPSPTTEAKVAATETTKALVATTAAPTPTTAAPAGTEPATTVAPATTAAPVTTVVAAPATTAAPAATTTAAAPSNGSLSVFQLAVGTCIDNSELSSGLVTTVNRVSCDQPHSHEVYYKATFTPADAPYNAEQVGNFANQACTQGFESYVGIPYERSKYYFLHLAPSSDSWNKNNDRDVVCLLFLQGAKITGSVKGKAE